MVELHSWARCKPAFMAEGAPLAQRPRRGRPPRASSPGLPQPPSSKAEEQLTSPSNLSASPALPVQPVPHSRSDVKPQQIESKQTKNESAKIQTRLPRSTRNPNPTYT